MEAKRSSKANGFFFFSLVFGTARKVVLFCDSRYNFFWRQHTPDELVCGIGLMRWGHLQKKKHTNPRHWGAFPVLKSACYYFLLGQFIFNEPMSLALRCEFWFAAVWNIIGSLWLFFHSFNHFFLACGEWIGWARKKWIWKDRNHMGERNICKQGKAAACPKL